MKVEVGPKRPHFLTCAFEDFRLTCRPSAGTTLNRTPSAPWGPSGPLGPLIRNESYSEWNGYKAKNFEGSWAPKRLDFEPFGPPGLDFDPFSLQDPPWYRFVYRGWPSGEVQTCRGLAARLGEQPSPCRKPSARPEDEALPCRRLRPLPLERPKWVAIRLNPKVVKWEPEFTGLLPWQGFWEMTSNMDPINV